MFGSSQDAMPPILVYEDPDGILEISDGATRATRIAKLAPGRTVPILLSVDTVEVEPLHPAWESYYD